MGKSQLSHFLREEFKKESENSISEFHTFSPLDNGFDELRNDLRNCFYKCNKNNPFHFFIDEIDLISDPTLDEKEKVKCIERFGNIIIKTSDEAYIKDIPFHIFLVLSNRILEDFEKFAPHRIKRRITPFIRADISFNKKDIETFAINFFSMLWVFNYKDIRNRLKNNGFKFKEYISLLISDFVNNLDYLELDINSSVVGDLVDKFRNVFEILFDGVNDTQLEKANLRNESNLGKKIELIIKEYLLSKNRPFLLPENEPKITVIYKSENLPINGSITDGYYDFRIGDTQVGIMPVEITVQKDLKNRKRKQLKSFTEEHISLLIWCFIDRDILKSELEKIDTKVKNDLHKILIPKDLIQYTLILQDRVFSFIEEIRRDIMSEIKTYLNRYAKILYNRWMMEKPFTKKHVKIQDGKEHKLDLTDLKDRAVRLLENVFEHLNGAAKRRQHKGMKSKLKQELKSLNKPLQDAGIKLPLFDSEIVYKEIIGELKEAKICKYGKMEDKSFLNKDIKFSVDNAVNQCKSIIISRIEEKLK